MSLFGTSPTESTQPNSSLNSKSLFGDEVTPAATSTSSLFADDSTDASPWSMPTPKKAARKELVKNLLPATDVPESYVDAYDRVLESRDRVGAGVGLSGVRKLLESSELDASSQGQIFNLVLPGGQDSATALGRSEFNVLLALIGLGQEGEDVSLDGVDERRRSTCPPITMSSTTNIPSPGLPIPKIAYLDKLQSQALTQHSNGSAPQRPKTPPSQTPQKENISSRPRHKRQDSLGGDPESDPWASPAVPNSIPPSTAAHTVRPNGTPEHIAKSTPASLPQRTTSTFTTHGSSPPEGNSQPGGTGGVGWNSFNGSSGAGFSEQPTLGGGFGDSGEGQGNRESENLLRRSMGASAAALQGSREIVTITMLPEKEGMFMFQHRNYEVKSIRRASSVVRRYSDFVWLLDCLQKRYPFRRLPLLPPKRVQGMISRIFLPMLG